MLPHLFQFGDTYREEGLELQRDVADFEVEVQAAVDEIWVRPAEEDVETAPEGWAARMAEIEKSKAINPIDKVPKPDTSKLKEWRVNLLDL